MEEKKEDKEKTKKEVKNKFEFPKDKKTIALIVFGVLLLGSVIFSVSAFYKYKTFTDGGEWYCIANKCTDYYSNADNLIKNICEVKEGKMVCEFELKGENYKVSLDELDINSLLNIKDYQTFRDGCSQWKCSTQLFLKGGGE